MQGTLTSDGVEGVGVAFVGCSCFRTFVVVMDVTRGLAAPAAVVEFTPC